ncbi:MAG: peptidoglycan DD-metalloendopeptidase family protein [Cytophagaceae bacterium]|nr:peptidoglycan DD-metalloendopeptidase family protein [Cytophagaceae bacterium]
MRRFIPLFPVFFASFIQAQTPPPPNYFQFPILPGQQNLLSGSFAELRPDHFHAGIDIKTQYREGLAVHSAAAGYVSRVAVMAGGYGNVLFVTHPNGYVSVYGHLLRFNPRIAAYVRQRQYKAESFEIDLKPGADELPVSKSEIMALSGNSGSSAGPHLHFEIRNERGLLVDPQRFNFPEIEDDVPPVIEALALRPLGIQSRLNDAFDRQEFSPIQQSDGQFVLADTLWAAGTLGLEILAYDRANGTANQNGLSCVEVHLDGQEVHFHALENLPVEYSRDLNVHTDYATQRLTGRYFQRCYVVDGNDQLPIYKPSPTRGQLLLTPGLHQVTVTAWDTYQNKSAVTFWVRGTTDATLQTVESLTNGLLPTFLTQSVEDNTLVLKAQNPATANSPAQLFFQKSQQKTLVPVYRFNGEAVYLWDLRRGLPDSVSVDSVRKKLFFRQMLIPGKAQTIRGENWRVHIGPRAFYDTLYLTAIPGIDVLQLGPVGTPLREAITVSLAPPLADSLRKQTAAYTFNGTAEHFLGGKWRGNTLTFQTHTLGSFTARTDTTPPKIKLLSKDREAFRFYVDDDLSGIRAFRATVGSAWVLMNYEAKKGLLWSEKPDSTAAFNGQLELRVSDNSGNTAIFSTDFETPFPTPKTQKRLVQMRRKGGTRRLK